MSQIPFLKISTPLANIESLSNLVGSQIVSDISNLWRVNIGRVSPTFYILCSGKSYCETGNCHMVEMVCMMQEGRPDCHPEAKVLEVCNISETKSRYVTCLILHFSCLAFLQIQSACNILSDSIV